MTSHYPQECSPRQQYDAMMILSQDGYIHLAFESFRQVEMVHLFSGMDEDRPTATGTGASSYPITGYTEWVSHGSPAISIGWDWELIGTQGKVQLIRTGTPGSNVMFVDQHGNDLGPARTKQSIATWLSTFTWQAKTLEEITAATSTVNSDSCLSWPEKLKSTHRVL